MDLGVDACCEHEGTIHCACEAWAASQRAARLAWDNVVVLDENGEIAI